jgi:hypothetical protein
MRVGAQGCWSDGNAEDGGCCVGCGSWGRGERRAACVGWELFDCELPAIDPSESATEWCDCYAGQDLDYSYSRVGDMPKYLPALAFPPSYFHRVIRTGPTSSNPVVHIDISPWGEEIATNLQLLQDRVRTET